MPNRPTVVITKPNSSPSTKRGASAKAQQSNAVEAANTNKQLVPAYSRQLFVPQSFSGTNNSNATKKATTVMQAPNKASAAGGGGNKAPQVKVKGAVSPVTIVSPGGKMFMRTVKNTTASPASPVIADMSPVT